jgi:hypothetical protein
MVALRKIDQRRDKQRLVLHQTQHETAPEDVVG